MTPKQRREYWRKGEVQRMKLERKYRGQIEEVLNRHMSSFTSVSDSMLESWNTELLGVYQRMFRETFLTFSGMTYNSLKGQKFVGMGVAEEWTQYVNNWLAQYGLQMVVTISGNSRDLLLRIVNEAIQEGTEQGLGEAEIARMIQARLNDERYTFTRFRAARIARTETNRASNMGHMEGAKSLPFEVSKVWIAAKDERTRRIPRDEFDHWTLDGQTVDYYEPFNSMGVQAMQPGDTSAPAGFTINCRCRVAFEPKRDRNGKLIRKR
jgi:hypothetical protein